MSAEWALEACIITVMISATILFCSVIVSLTVQRVVDVLVRINRWRKGGYDSCPDCRRPWSNDDSGKNSPGIS